MRSLLYSAVVVFLAGGAVCSGPKQRAEQKPDPTPPISANPGGGNVPDSKPEGRKPERTSDNPPSYVKDVKPFLATYCVECHNGRQAKAGYNVDGFEPLMKGGRKGPAVVSGEPDRSAVVRVLSGQGKRMPPQKYKNQPKADEVDALKAWIAAGAHDDTENTGG
jgi:hypothetical protein